MLGLCVRVIVMTVFLRDAIPKVQSPQMPQREQLWRQRRQPQSPQVEEARLPLRLFGDALQGNAHSIEIVRHTRSMS